MVNGYELIILVLLVGVPQQMDSTAEEQVVVSKPGSSLPPFCLLPDKFYQVRINKCG